MSAIDIKNVSKTFDGSAVLSDVSLSIAQGEVVSLIGPSGCGKSTLLRLLAGLEHDYDGELTINGATPERARASIGLMFQEPRLMPWLTVRDNIGFGLRNAASPEIRAKIDTLLADVGLQNAADQLPKQLSGGMAQRAALARALLREPAVLLLDEPFSAVDAITRLSLQSLLFETWQRRKLSTLLVTHDLDEALTLSDRVVVLSGRPAGISAVLGVRVPRPRDRNSYDHTRLRAELFSALHLAKTQGGQQAAYGVPFGV